MAGALLFLLNGCKGDDSFDKNNFLTKEAHEKFKQELSAGMNAYSYQIKYEIVHEILKQIERLRQIQDAKREEEDSDERFGLLRQLIADIFQISAEEIEKKLIDEKTK